MNCPRILIPRTSVNKGGDKGRKRQARKQFGEWEGSLTLVLTRPGEDAARELCTTRNLNRSDGLSQSKT